MEILIDWITVVVYFLTPEQIITLLGLSENQFISKGSHYRYKKCRTFAGINIYYGGRPEMGVCLELSGTGCRNYEDLTGMSPLELIKLLFQELGNTFHVTRLDLAIDDHNKLLNIEQLNQARINREYVSKLKNNKLIEATNSIGRTARTLYFGTKGGNISLRIYDKEIESKTYGKPWIRVELQLRNGAAQNAAVELLTHDFGQTTKGILLNTIRFVIPQTDANRSRWPIQPYWEAFTDNCSAINVCAHSSSEQDYEKSKKQFFKQYGRFLGCITAIDGPDYLLQKAVEYSSNFSPKQQAWIEADIARKNRSARDEYGQDKSTKSVKN